MADENNQERSQAADAQVSSAAKREGNLKNCRGCSDWWHSWSRTRNC